MFQLEFLSVSSSSPEIHCKSECWNQRHIRVGETSNTNTSTHKLKPKSSVHNFEMSETLLEERHFSLATKQEIKWAIVEYNLCDTSINVRDNINYADYVLIRKTSSQFLWSLQWMVILKLGVTTCFA